MNLSSTDYDKINNSRLIRCNWAFKDPSRIKKEYSVYFSQAYPVEEAIANELDFACECNRVHIHDSVTYVLYDNCSGTALATPTRSPVYSTTGGQMLLYATFKLKPKQLNLAGIDLYTHDRPQLGRNPEAIRNYLETTGKPFSINPTGSIGLSMFKPNLTYIHPIEWSDLLFKKKHTVHSLETDVLLLLRSFAQLYMFDTKITFMNTPHLERIYIIAREHVDLCMKYFNLQRDFLNSDDSMNVCYQMFKIINQLCDEISPESY